MNNIKKILILVELDDGNVHQVYTTKEQKEMALHLLKNEKRGKLMLSKEPIELEFKDE